MRRHYLRETGDTGLWACHCGYDPVPILHAEPRPNTTLAAVRVHLADIMNHRK